jgi:transcriptional antiterminator RfaH
MNDGIWYVVRTKPRQETVAEANLLRQGYAAYLPRLKVLRRIRRQQVSRLEPMFPQYLFFRPGREGQSIAPVRSTLGVLGVVRFGIEPAELDAKKLDAILALESRQNQASIEELSAIVPGSRVAIVEGPLAGLEGLVSSVSAKRVEVLMQLLGNDTRVRFAPSALELAA